MESTTNGGEIYRSIVNRTKSAYKSPELLLSVFKSKEKKEVNVMSENIVSKTAVVANITEISTKQLCEFSDKHILRLSGRPQPFLEYSPETKPETPANATAADTKAVADRVIYYLNRARANIGSRELKKLPRLTGYAEYRSSQLPSNFAHDISDWFAAAKATGYGKYT